MTAMLFQSTQPEWAATGRLAEALNVSVISIHAARVGCDIVPLLEGGEIPGISIHAARVGCDAA